MVIASREGQARATGVTAVLDAWPYALAEIEQAVYSAANIADRVMVVVPDLVCRYTPEDFATIPCDVLQVPFLGNFTTVRNIAVKQVNTSWVWLLFGNERFVAADSGVVMRALEADPAPGYRMTIMTSEQAVLAQPVRLLPFSPQLQFVGRIWPEVSGSLIEFGYKLETLPARIFREQDRQSSLPATSRLMAQLTRAAAITPHDGRIPLALAILSWAQTRYADARRQLERLPRGASGEVRILAEGLRAWLWLEQGQPDKADVHVKALLREDPERAEFWYILGESELRRRRYDRAEWAFYRAVGIGETFIPYLPPGYASYAARLKAARAEISARKTALGVAHLLALLEEYPGYRTAWQEVLSHLRGMSEEDIFLAMGTVIAPSKIRHFFGRLDHPTDEERRIAEWLRTS